MHMPAFWRVLLPFAGALLVIVGTVSHGHMTSNWRAATGPCGEASRESPLWLMPGPSSAHDSDTTCSRPRSSPHAGARLGLDASGLLRVPRLGGLLTARIGTIVRVSSMTQGNSAGLAYRNARELRIPFASMPPTSVRTIPGSGLAQELSAAELAGMPRHDATETRKQWPMRLAV